METKFSNAQELRDGLSMVELEERLEMVQLVAASECSTFCDFCDNEVEVSKIMAE